MEPSNTADEAECPVTPAELRLATDGFEALRYPGHAGMLRALANWVENRPAPRVVVTREQVKTLRDWIDIEYPFHWSELEAKLREIIPGLEVTQ